MKYLYFWPGIGVVMGISMILIALTVGSMTTEINGMVIGKEPEIGGWGSAHPNYLVVRTVDDEVIRVDVHEEYFSVNVNDTINITSKFFDTEHGTIFSFMMLLGGLLLIFSVVSGAFLTARSGFG